MHPRLEPVIADEPNLRMNALNDFKNAMVLSITKPKQKNEINIFNGW